MVVIGAGGFAKELLQVLLSEKYDFNEKNLFFYDDVNNLPKKKFFDKFKILTSISEVQEIFKNVSPDFCIGVGMSKIRYQLCQKFENIGGTVKSIISQNSSLGIFDISIREGVTIMSEVTISNAVKIGKCSLINVNVMIGHDTVVGDFCDVSPGIIITGHCKMGDFVEVGSGVILLPGIKIGSNCIISAGSVISQDIPDNSKVVGTIPSRVIEKLPPFKE